MKVDIMKVPGWINKLLKSTASRYYLANIDSNIALEWLEKQGFDIENFDSYIDLIEMCNNPDLFIENLENDKYEMYKRKDN